MFFSKKLISYEEQRGSPGSFAIELIEHGIESTCPWPGLYRVGQVILLEPVGVVKILHNLFPFDCSGKEGNR